MTALRWLLRIAAAGVALLALLFLGARLHDGPLGPIPGGVLEAGEEVTVPVTDWSFATDVAEIELQLTSQPRSRITWLLVREGEAYVPCALGFPPGKRWHRDAVVDGRAVLRIEGKRYPVTLTKLDDAETAERRAALESEMERKYGRTIRGAEGVWLFRVASRAPAS